MYSPDLLKDKIVVVTGGGSGLGLAMAKRAAALSARVAICGRSEDKLKIAAKEFSDKSRFYYAPTDVRDFDAV
ncbi:MAG: SDR family NAD(P)-dependent oxidoreductase, partial [Bdellovibrionales bacterium]|nr:SDR family NAD(P)-dependent oxidoreductase [Bdellovibrionales bacterium]